MKRCLFASMVLAVCLVASAPAEAQNVSPREELLALVPGDSGFCLVVQNLRGHIDKWQRSAWVKALRESPLGQAILNSPEVQHLLRVQDDMKKRLDVDWPSLRDDILGDAVVFAYRPALPGNPEQEQGLLLVRARKADALARLVERLNEEQKKSGELKNLAMAEHRGVKYQRRTDKRSTHFVLVDGNLFVLTGTESLLRGVIDQRQGKNEDKNAIVQQMNRAGTEQALASLWINPRAFEAELDQKAQKDAGPEAVMLRTFLAYWRPMEAIVLSISDAEQFELRMAMQARTKELPASLRKIFTEPMQPSELWGRFPTTAVLTLADRLDLALLSESLGDFSTPENRKQVLEALQKTVGAALSLDLAKDVLPNVGPDWGICVAAADNPGQFPHVLAALAVRPGPGEAVDQALFKGVQFFASLVVFDFNRKNPNPLRLKSLMQGNIDVRYVAGDKVFPAGLQPAWALKEGYLVFASHPDALLRFRLQTTTPAAGPDVPVLRFSTTELARLLRERRQQVVDHFAEKNRLPKAVANQGLEATLAVLDLIDHVTLSQSSGAGQLSWVLRVRTKKE